MSRWVFLLLAALLASCGVATDDNAVPINLGEQPPGLVPTSTSTTLPVPDPQDVTAYFFDPQPEAERLVDRRRQAAPPVDVAAVVNALLAGTTEVERELVGLRSEIPDDVELLGFEREGDLIILDFNQSFEEVEGDAQSRAFAQIVYTVDALVDDAKIVFHVEGEPKGALTDVGEQVSRCVTVHDYPTLHPDYDPDDPPEPVPPPTDCDIETIEG
jgi:spore germination protein GerM